MNRLKIRSAGPASGSTLAMVIVAAVAWPGFIRASFAAEPPLAWSIAPADEPRSPELILTGPREIGPVRLWVPEAVFTVPGAAAIYPLCQPWRRAGEAWQQASDDEALFARNQVRRLDDGTIEFHKLQLELAGPVRWETEVHPSGDTVTFSIKLSNTSQCEIKQAAAAVCVKFLEGQPWWSAERTLVLCDGRARPLSELGQTESRFYRPNPFQLYLVRDAKFDNPFYHQVWGVNEHRLSRPLMVSEHRAAGLSVMVSAKDAYFLHCNRGNPCTDVMLAFGDLKPGQSAVSTGQIQVRHATAASVLRDLSVEKSAPAHASEP